MSERDPQDATAPEGLRALIEAARTQPIIETSVTADAVLAGLEQHRARAQGRRTLTLSAALAFAASVVAVALLWPMLSAREARKQDRGAHLQSDTSQQFDVPRSAPLAPADLASAIKLRTGAAVEVRGPWAIALGEGVHELEVSATPGRALRVTLPDRELELVEGTAIIEVVEGTAAVQLHSGVAAWVTPDGPPTVISVERVEQEFVGGHVPERAPRSAAALAREADSLLAAGKPDEAIKVLRRLVSGHPRASQTRAAVLDLARLLRNAKRGAEARCAYELYLHRWPGSAVEGEILSQLDQLAAGRDCRGLDPS